jgi:hypothetical protein
MNNKTNLLNYVRQVNKKFLVTNLPPNVRVYDPLRGRSANLSGYNKATRKYSLRNRPKGAHVAKRSKLTTSNGLNMLAEGNLTISISHFIIIQLYNQCKNLFWLSYSCLFQHCFVLQLIDPKILIRLGILLYKSQE